jgi:UDP-N-acetylmuramate: L-alanyl-gamma-D-glutamyl-meso-diaminopimelate ligase
LGISDNDFNTAISSFGGTARRLEKIKQTDDLIIFRDFAHSPSKVKATVDAVKKQYPTHNVVACFELHTYSSLNSDFLAEYHQSLTAADEAIVYFNEHVLELKKLPPLDIEEVAEAFGGSIEVYTDSKMLHRYLKTPHPKKTVLLLMSSGNFNNMDLNF